MEEVRRGETGKKRRKRLDKGGGRNIEKHAETKRIDVEKGSRWERRDKGAETK